MDAVLLPRLPLPSLDDVRETLTPDLLRPPAATSAPAAGGEAPRAAGGTTGGARAKRRALAPEPAPAAPLLPAWRAVEAAREASAAARAPPLAPGAPVALLVPDLPGTEVVELGADVAVSPAAISAALRALQALLVGRPQQREPAAAAAAALGTAAAAEDAEPAAEAAATAPATAAASLAAACWCRAPHARSLAPFPDAIDERILSHVERLMLAPSGPA